MMANHQVIPAFSQMNPGEFERLKHKGVQLLYVSPSIFGQELTASRFPLDVSGK